MANIQGKKYIKQNNAPSSREIIPTTDTSSLHTNSIDNPNNNKVNLAAITASKVYGWFNNNRRKKHKCVITDEAVELIKKSASEEAFDGYRFIDTILEFRSILDEDSDIQLEDYINAVRFCSYLEVYKGNAIEAYIEAFRYKEFVDKKRNAPRDSREYLSLVNAASRYRKHPLVKKILAQSEIPLYIMFQGYRYAAVEKLVEEMNNAKLSRDRINAADKLLLHLKAPEGIEVNVNVKKDSETIIDTYQEAIMNMIQKQKALIQNGGNMHEIVNASIKGKEKEVIDIEESEGNA